MYEIIEANKDKINKYMLLINHIKFLLYIYIKQLLQFFIKVFEIKKVLT